MKHAIRSSGRLKLKHTCYSFEELEKHLLVCIEKYQLICISSSFAKEAAEAIQECITEHPKLEGVPTILLVDSSLTQGDVITQLLLGYDGVLMQPFSIEEMNLVVDSAFASIEAEHQRRERTLMKVFAQSLRECQSDTAYQLSHGSPARISRRVMHELAKSVRELPTHFYMSYFMALFREYERERRESIPQEHFGRRQSRASESYDRRSSAGIFTANVKPRAAGW
ncbi:MAG: hypothetical protein KDD70_02460 [Bdellovibrionales bacterium]|nr:hypothetical protein [Bdellovibrionales bacterium]